MGEKKERKKERKKREREGYLKIFFRKLVSFKSLLEGYFNSDFDEISV